MHHPCAETILNVTLSLGVAPLFPCAESDGITALYLLRKLVYDDFAGACFWYVPLCMCACDLGAASTALQLTL